VIPLKSKNVIDVFDLSTSGNLSMHAVPLLLSTESENAMKQQVVTAEIEKRES
jgi:hypothetical protein